MTISKFLIKGENTFKFGEISNSENGVTFIQRCFPIKNKDGDIEDFRYLTKNRVRCEDGKLRHQEKIELVSTCLVVKATPLIFNGHYGIYE